MCEMLYFFTIYVHTIQMCLDLEYIQTFPSMRYSYMYSIYIHVNIHLCCTVSLVSPLSMDSCRVQRRPRR